MHERHGGIGRHRNTYILHHLRHCFFGPEGKLLLLILILILLQYYYHYSVTGCVRTLVWHGNK